MFDKKIFVQILGRIEKRFIEEKYKKHFERLCKKDFSKNTASFI